MFGSESIPSCPVVVCMHDFGVKYIGCKYTLLDYVISIAPSNRVKLVSVHMLNVQHYNIVYIHGEVIMKLQCDEMKG